MAISVKSSFPQFDTQSSTLVAAEDDADIKRYANICIFIDQNYVRWWKYKDYKWQYGRQTGEVICQNKFMLKRVICMFIEPAGMG